VSSELLKPLLKFTFNPEGNPRSKRVRMPLLAQQK
jgi:hypothetical protein